MSLDASSLKRLWKSLWEGLFVLLAIFGGLSAILFFRPAIKIDSSFRAGAGHGPWDTRFLVTNQSAYPLRDLRLVAEIIEGKRPEGEDNREVVVLNDNMPITRLPA